MDKRKAGRYFGYADHESIGYVKGLYYQEMSGYSVGIIYIGELNYPMIPGNIVSAYTYDFPVRHRAVEGLDIPKLFAGQDPTVADQIIKLGQHMIDREGIRALCSACGFFGNYHSAVAAALDIPVALSSLVQVNWVRSVIKPGQKIGILTADKSSLTPELMKSVGVTDTSDLIIKDLRHAEQFSAILEYRGEFDNRKVQEEVVGKALELLEEDADIGGIILECSDMPPYAWAIQHATQLPVWDFTTLIRWLHYCTTCRPYSGWI
ncbi:MAG: aspartate/glutamate racemase family protein [Clostridiales Family XIII bacterium]|nr:aspartate/glutamate racemase family protein [Clostridiales Family XIII bacterium]